MPQRPPRQRLSSNALVSTNGVVPGWSANLTLGLLHVCPSLAQRKFEKSDTGNAAYPSLHTMIGGLGREAVQ
jgi:hypothetical protein